MQGKNFFEIVKKKKKKKKKKEGKGHNVGMSFLYSPAKIKG